MAGKKPAKVNSSNKKEAVVLPGKAIKYMGSESKQFECPACKRTLTRGIIYEHNNETFCSRGCIPKELPVAAE